MLNKCIDGDFPSLLDHSYLFVRLGHFPIPTVPLSAQHAHKRKYCIRYIAQLCVLHILFAPGGDFLLKPALIKVEIDLLV